MSGVPKYLCPVSHQKVNERVVRFNAAFTLMFVVAFLLTRNSLLMVLLGVDFFLRAGSCSRYSPLVFMSQTLSALLPGKGTMINAGPIIFAARIGCFMICLLIIAWVLTFHNVALVLASVLALFSFLEAAFGICVACYIYPYVFRWTQIH